jgi:hypothetical protein
MQTAKPEIVPPKKSPTRTDHRVLSASPQITGAAVWALFFVSKSCNGR